MGWERNEEPLRIWVVRIWRDDDRKRREWQQQRVHDPPEREQQRRRFLGEWSAKKVKMTKKILGLELQEHTNTCSSQEPVLLFSICSPFVLLIEKQEISNKLKQKQNQSQSKTRLYLVCLSVCMKFQILK